MAQRKILYAAASFLIFAATGLLAQDQPHAWRTAEPSQDQALSAQNNQGGPPPPPRFSAGQAGQAGPANAEPQYRQEAPVPAQLTIRPGTFVSIRVNQTLSSDRNQPGDTFFATLAQPVVVDGIVVARHGETVMGRVTEAQKAGRVEGTSRLGIELTGLTLADGTQLTVQSQMINRNGDTSVGRDVGAVATTTALGAAIGAGADWGRGAAIGAGAGAAAGLIGVLLTRGHPTVIYPESMLTFRVTSPAVVVTERAPLAFRYADNQDYSRGYSSPEPRPVVQSPGYGYRPGYYPYDYGYGYGYPYYGSGFSFYVGPRFYGGYRGFYRGGRR